MNLCARTARRNGDEVIVALTVPMFRIFSNRLLVN